MFNNGVACVFLLAQTPPALRKHPGGDRTGNFVSRTKMTQDLASVINDGLYYYEQGLWEWEDDIDIDIVSVGSIDSNDSSQVARNQY